MRRGRGVWCSAGQDAAVGRDRDGPDPGRLAVPAVGLARAAGAAHIADPQLPLVPAGALGLLGLRDASTAVPAVGRTELAAHGLGGGRIVDRDGRLLELSGHVAP